MENNGDFIKLYRKFTKWGWYTDVNTKSIFLHLLILARWTPGEFLGIKLDRGQYACNLPKLMEQTGMTRQQLRTSIEKLKKTNELTTYREAGYTVYTIVSYDSYQSTNQRPTNDQPTTNQRPTNDQPIIEEEGKKERKKEKTIGAVPTFFEFFKYAYSKNPKVDRAKLQMKYEAWKESGWCVPRGNKLEPIKIWKTTLLNTMTYGNLDADPKENFKRL
jgi:biotin operon repressor